MQTTSTPVGFGPLLRHWRTTRRYSQLRLATQAEISTRHLSFLENGRARPSRQMVLLLASQLEIPLRERNALLTAAGFAPAYRETSLDAPEMASVRRALDFICQRHEPYPVYILDRAWNPVRVNGAAERLRQVLLPPHLHDANIMELTFLPDGLRPLLVNWEQVARAMIARLQRELLAQPDDEAAALLERILAAPGVDPAWRQPALDQPGELLLPLHLRWQGLEVRLFSTITTLGTPTDITLSELRIETFFPADDVSDQIVRSLAGAGQ